MKLVFNWLVNVILQVKTIFLKPFYCCFSEHFIEDTVLFGVIPVLPFFPAFSLSGGIELHIYSSFLVTLCE